MKKVILVLGFAGLVSIGSMTAHADDLWKDHCQQNPSSPECVTVPRARVALAGSFKKSVSENSRFRTYAKQLPQASGEGQPDSQDAQGPNDSCDGKDEEIASLQSRLDAMTNYAVSLQTQLMNTDDEWAACLRGRKKSNQDDSDKMTCNLVLSFLSGPLANTLCELIGNT